MREFEQLLAIVDLIDGDVHHRRLRKRRRGRQAEVPRRHQEDPGLEARSTAERACNQITTSNANVSTALNKAKQTCLTAAAKIPIASLKQAAEAQCNKITAQ